MLSTCQTLLESAIAWPYFGTHWAHRSTPLPPSMPPTPNYARRFCFCRCTCCSNMPSSPKQIYHLRLQAHTPAHIVHPHGHHCQPHPILISARIRGVAFGILIFIQVRKDTISTPCNTGIRGSTAPFQHTSGTQIEPISPHCTQDATRICVKAF